MNNNYLEHHGIKGMKWYERRFQNEDGSLTPAGRVRYGVGKPRPTVSIVKKITSKISGSDEEKSQRAEKQQLRKEARMERRQQRKEARAEKAAAKEEQQKQKILQSGDANLILDNVKRFSNQELQEGLNRARNINAVKQMQAEQAFSRIEGAVSRFAKIANTGLSAVSTVENIRNGIDKIKSWGEEKDFIGKTPEELLDSAKDLSTAGMKKLTDRLNSIVSATRNVNEINTSGLKSELEKLKTLEEIRKARETYKDNLSGKKKNNWRDEIWKETPENILKNIENGKYKTEEQLKVAVDKLTLVGNASNNMTKLGVAIEKFKPKTVPQPQPTNPPNPQDDKQQKQGNGESGDKQQKQGQKKEGSKKVVRPFSNDDPELIEMKRLAQERRIARAEKDIAEREKKYEKLHKDLENAKKERADEEVRKLRETIKEQLANDEIKGKRFLQLVDYQTLSWPSEDSYKQSKIEKLVSDSLKGLDNLADLDEPSTRARINL